MLSVNTLVGNAQYDETDFLNNAKNFPPSFTTPENRKLSTQVLEWRMKLLSAMHKTYAESRDGIQGKLSHIDALIELEQGSLPVEIRFTDAQSRSELVGRVLQLILETRVESATKESMLESLTKSMEESNSESEAAQMLRADLEIAVIETKAIEAEYARAVELQKQGLVQSQEVSRLENSRQISKLNLMKMEQAYANALRQPASVAAKRLSEVRLEIQPLKAKLKAAEAFLATFNESSARFQRLESLHRERELHNKDLAFVATEIGTVSRELTELEVLSELMEPAAGERSTEQEVPAE